MADAAPTGTKDVATGQSAATGVRVSVVYAMPDRVWQQELALAQGSTVADAIAASGFREAFPAVDPLAAGLGVFGVRRDPSYPLVGGDRVEIYRPLVFDPMESRRRRAQHKANRQR